MIIMRTMNVLLIDNSPLVHKTLQYFLHPYAPSIYSLDSQEEWPQKIDIIFLDSEQRDSECIPHLKEKSAPIVLLSRNEKTLEEMSSQYPLSLKKPIRYSQLHETIHHLIPETRSFKASPYLRFYENTADDENEPVALHQPPSESAPLGEEPPQELNEEMPVDDIPLEPAPPENASPGKPSLEPAPPENTSPGKPSLEPAPPENTSPGKPSLEPAPPENTSPGKPSLEEEPLKNIPIAPEDPEQNTPVHADTNSSSFDKKKSITIPEGVQLVDPEDAAALHNTNTLLKKISEHVKEKTQFSSKNSKTPEKTPRLEDAAGSQLLETTMEEPPPAESVELKNEKEDSSLSNSSEHTLFDFTNAEVLSPQMMELIEKNVREQWKVFANTHLKKELKKIIHKEVAQIFKEQMKDILTTEGIQSIKKASEEISWKVIPELSKQIIQKEIEKLLDKPPSK